MKIKSLISELRLYICNHIINKIPSHTFRLFFYRSIMKFDIGRGSYIFLGCTFDAAKGLKIGKNSVINAKCRIDTRGGIKIGDNCSISNNVSIITADHDMNTPNMQGRTSETIIGNNVWIGTEAMLLPSLIIGSGAVVAARALVTKHVYDFEVVGGVPAKHIKERKCKTNYTYSASYKRLFQ